MRRIAREHVVRRYGARDATTSLGKKSRLVSLFVPFRGFFAGTSYSSFSYAINNRRIYYYPRARFDRQNPSTNPTCTLSVSAVVIRNVPLLIALIHTYSTRKLCTDKSARDDVQSCRRTDVARVTAHRDGWTGETADGKNTDRAEVVIGVCTVNTRD